MVRKQEPLLEPLIGEWYRDHGEQRVFEVVGLDESAGRINIQYADGDVLSLNRDSWRDLLLSFAPPPEESGDDEATGGLPADDWHDNHDSIDLDDY